MVSAVAGCSGDDDKPSADSSPGATTASLEFDKNAFTEKTATVPTSAGDREITYKLWSKLPYVSKPVDVNYQSLSIAVPTKIDGKEIDASKAPILFEIPVGGYLSSEATDDPLAARMPVGGGMGGPGGGAGANGGPQAGASGAPGGGMPQAGASGAAGGGFPGGGASGAPGGGMPQAGASGAAGVGQNGVATGVGSLGQNVYEAIANGWVVVTVAARGRDNKSTDGTFFGKAPAVIVDLKAAVRYLRHNKADLPGDTDKMVSDGSSAGGGVSALLGASADSDLYEKYLTELGAADASDAIFGVAAYCPITDLDNADTAYEFLYGSLAANGQQVDQTVSKDLSEAFPAYQDGLGLKGLDDRTLTAARYKDYLLTQYLQPSAGTYLANLSSTDRTAYLATNTWIKYSGGKARFSFADYLTHLGRRKKTEPAFDAFDLSAGENIEFGTETTDARHFTAYSAKKDSSGTGTTVGDDIADLLTLMNPMYFIKQKNEGRAKNWFIRLGTSDTDTALTVSANLAAGFHTLGDTVDHLMYWDAGHGANEDPDKFIAWANKITGHTAP
ncbi:subtype B tannase [Actinoplanes sp. NPDC051851]|uniref:subtype B tannase n=1 Tax=Actinoplanes sp. NPDC051851 TaxID=3154753 RepID=UPI00341E3192